MGECCCYVAAFLLPSPIARCLTDAGWAFFSLARLPDKLIVVLETEFDARHTEIYLGMDVWRGEGVKFTVIRDPSCQIELISAQLYGHEAAKLEGVLASAGFKDVEVFVLSASDA
ncbi:hypothetical protein GCM10007388_00020 [Pseudoduganella plicata]|uniref:Uncharacterized protein n=1 Tax=Pseudoduganella plicata TaxID=321984 RepID=A0AA88C9N8_9BURK|nr:hypothetical protein GCM10007388_00020 [Pseudoduganella plicata]